MQTQCKPADKAYIHTYLHTYIQTGIHGARSAHTAILGHTYKQAYIHTHIHSARPARTVIQGQQSVHNVNQDINAQQE